MPLFARLSTAAGVAALAMIAATAGPRAADFWLLVAPDSAGFSSDGLKAHRQAFRDLVDQ